MTRLFDHDDGRVTASAPRPLSRAERRVGAGGPVIGRRFAWAKAVVAVALEHTDRLREFHTTFAQDMDMKLRTYGERAFVSTRQINVLNEIEAELDRLGLIRINPREA